MVTKTKLTAGVILTLIIAISGTYYVAQDDDAYYCESKDMVMICDKLSSGLGTRCYFDETYKICSEGWTKLEIGQEVGNKVQPQTSKKYLCNQIECIEIE